MIWLYLSFSWTIKALSISNEKPVIFLAEVNTSLLPQAKSSTIIRSPAYPGLPDYIPFTFPFTISILPLHYCVRERQSDSNGCASETWEVMHRFHSERYHTLGKKLYTNHYCALKCSCAQACAKLSRNGLTSKAACKEKQHAAAILSSWQQTLPTFNPIFSFKHLHSTHNVLLRLQTYCTRKMLT